MDDLLASKDPFEGFKDPKTNKFPYDELKGAFPEGVKPDKKEDYLTDEEFVTVFKVNREKWHTFKLWK